MDPGHDLVKTDRTASLGSGHPRRSDGIVRGHEIQISRHAAESRMQIAGGRAGALAPSVEGGGYGDNQRYGRDQTQSLMDLQHVCPFVQQRLLAGVSLSLFRSKAQIRKRRRCTAGWGVWEIILLL